MLWVREGPVTSGGVWLATTLAQLWVRTLHFRVAYYDPTMDPYHPECKHPKIYVFWHEYLLCPLLVRPASRMILIVSRHRDAEILNRIAHRLGFVTVRGSTYRGGSNALLRIVRNDRPLHIAITPDGPRGPRRTVAPGAVFLASRLQVPIVPLGIGYDRPLRAPTWDRFAIPVPGSRARCVVGPAIWIPGRLGRQELERHRQRVEAALRELTEVAERWAEGRGELLGSVPLLHRRDFAHQDPSEQACPLSGKDRKAA